MSKIQKIDCPVCKGSGKLVPPKMQQKRSRRLINNRIMARLLTKAGYSQREIMPYLGYRSSRSIAMLLEKKKRP